MGKHLPAELHWAKGGETILKAKRKSRNSSIREKELIKQTGKTPTKSGYILSLNRSCDEVAVKRGNHEAQKVVASKYRKKAGKRVQRSVAEQSESKKGEKTQGLSDLIICIRAPPEFNVDG